MFDVFSNIVRALAYLTPFPAKFFGFLTPRGSPGDPAEAYGGPSGGPEGTDHYGNLWEQIA